MEDCEKTALRQLRPYLLEQIETSWIADELYSRDILSLEQLKYYKDRSIRFQRTSDLLLYLPDHCPLAILLEALDNVGQQHVSDEIKAKTDEIRTYMEEMPTSILQSKPNYGMSFKRYSKVAHNLQIRVFNLDKSMESLEDVVPFMKAMPAKGTIHFDDLFALSDAGLGMEKTYLKKSNPLHESPFFSHMKDVFEKTSFPELAETVFESRLAESLASQGNYSGALHHSELSMHRVNLEHPCRHNGKLLKTMVNILLQLYVTTKNENIKERLIRTVNEGIIQFRGEENEDARNLWSRMFLLRETFCHLGIDVYACDVPDVPLDVEKALASMARAKKHYWDGLDKRCNMLYLRALAKVDLIGSKTESAQQKLTKALEIANGNFIAEENVIKTLLSSLGESTCET